MANDETNMQPPGDAAAIPPSEHIAEAAAPFAKVHGSLDVVVTLPPPAVMRLSWEQWCGDKGVPLWKGEAARHGRAWPIGQEITEDEFNQALYDAFNTRIG